MAAGLAPMLPLFGDEPGAVELTGEGRADAAAVVTANHYAHSVPSGKSRYFRFGEALVIFSIPANNNIARYLVGETGHPGNVWELSRLWAPDSHEPNLLTQAISRAVSSFHAAEPDVLALISYADPNVGHLGGIYRAASWVYLGQVEDGRYYQSPEGQVVPRRKFHSADSFTRLDGILALGYVELRRPGRHRFARGLTPGARRLIKRRHPQWHRPAVDTANLPNRPTED